MMPFKFLTPRSEEDALGMYSKSVEPKFIAGGTNLVDLMKMNVSSPATLIDLNKISALHTIEKLESGGLRLGALARNSDTAYHPLVKNNYPLLSTAILAGASAQLRNMASNGGNLLQRTRCYYFYDTATPCNKRKPGSGCSAIGGYNRIHAILGTSENCIAVFPSDMCVALAALDARVNIISTDGEKTMLFSEFHRLPGETPHVDNNLIPGELISSIDLPDEDFSKNFAYLKLRDRTSYAFALISVASAFQMEDGKIKKARLALGGVAHKPWRDLEAEELLVGKKPEAHIFGEAADLMLKDAKGFGHNSFKIPLAKRAIIRNCLAAIKPEVK